MSDMTGPPATTPSENPNLPIELITLTSTFLSDTSSLRTVAQLNQTSKLVHQETEKALFETLVFKSVISWKKSMRFEIPKSWKLTKHVLLSHVTHELLQQHLSFMCHLKLVEKPTIESVFPKLALLAITDADGSTSLTLYKPFTLAEIFRRLDTDRFRRRSLFGTVFDPKHLKEHLCCPGCERSFEGGTGEIVNQLVLMGGAFLLPLPDDSIEEFHTTTKPAKLVDFHLKLRDSSVKHEDLVDSFRQVLRCIRRAHEVHTDAKEMTFHVKTKAESLGAFAEAMREEQPFLCNISISVSDNLVYTAIQGTLTSLAKVYSAHWSTTTIPKLRHHFLLISGLEKKVASEPATGSPGVSDKTQWVGALDLGHHVGGEQGGDQIERGFGAFVLGAEHPINSERPPETRFYQAYPCDEAYGAA